MEGVPQDTMMWLVLALAFNGGHIVFHAGFYMGRHSRPMVLMDAVVAYTGALFVLLLALSDTGALPVPFWPAVLSGAFVFTAGVVVHLLGHRDLSRFGKDMYKPGAVLVDRGIYAVIRHPMYVGGSLCYIGACLAARSLVGMATVWIWVLCVAVCGCLEGRGLRRDLGPGVWDGYVSRTWF